MLSLGLNMLLFWGVSNVYVSQLQKVTFNEINRLALKKSQREIFSYRVPATSIFGLHSYSEAGMR